MILVFCKSNTAEWPTGENNSLWLELTSLSRAVIYKMKGDSSVYPTVHCRVNLCRAAERCFWKGFLKNQTELN